MAAKKEEGRIERISGPVVEAYLPTARLYDVVKVGNSKLIGEIIKIVGSNATIQVYEDTSGLEPGEPVISTFEPLSVELGPGILQGIYDGIQRPLKFIEEKSKGFYIARGVEAFALDRTKKWNFVAKVKKGDKVKVGDIIGTVQETDLIEHRIISPVDGKVDSISSGSFTVEDDVAVVSNETKKIPLKMYQKWFVRKARPVIEKFPPNIPLITGSRTIDSFFPIAKGGTACIPGPFGSGKTVTQQSLAKYSDTQIVVYIGCGERGNEMTDVLREFPHLKDPNTGKPLMERTILIANTSNMPIAAREASVYTGITLAEYFRDMGYNVAMMADSTSRWAEAMREMSGRLEEMPGEEGYPAYLGSRISAFYERAGIVDCLGSENRRGSLSVIAAVSPAGGDLSEPVTQATLKVVKAFWGLDASLASKRHFPSINWLSSYSLYEKDVEGYYAKHAGSDWGALRDEAMLILQKENQLEDIIKLVGMDALSKSEKILLNTAKGLREDFLQQNAFDDIDTSTSTRKMYLMLKAMLSFHTEAINTLKANTDLEAEQVLSVPIRQQIARLKDTPEDSIQSIKELIDSIPDQFAAMRSTTPSTATDTLGVGVMVNGLQEQQ